MQLQTRFLGEPVSIVDVVPGDLFVWRTHAGLFLALKIEDFPERCALLLASIPADSPQSTDLPEVKYYVANESGYVPRLSGAFTVEPITMTTDEVLSACLDPIPTGFSTPIKNGSLALLADGRRAIYLRNRGPANLFDLSTGMEIERAGAKFITVADWRLTWREGTECVELFRSKTRP